MTDEELIARLREGNIGVNADKLAADRIEALTEQLTAARQDAEEAEAYVEELEAKLALMMTERDEAWKRAAHSEKMWGEAEVKLAKAVEALEALIQLAHDCEKELTEDLHHMDFCGESEPLTKARTTLAEIKGESHD